MYAVIETGGKQLKVKVGETIRVEKLNVQPGQEVVFDKVLCLNDGNNIKIGTPYIQGATVKAEVLDEAKGEKVLVYRPPSKKAIHKLRGHRQWYTKIKVKEIIGG